MMNNTCCCFSLTLSRKFANIAGVSWLFLSILLPLPQVPLQLNIKRRKMKRNIALGKWVEVKSRTNYRKLHSVNFAWLFSREYK